MLDGSSVPTTVLPSRTGAVSNLMDSSGQVPNGATVILFDMLNTTADDQAEAVKQLADYLKTIGREERIALYILAQQLYVVQDFTGDHKIGIIAEAKAIAVVIPESSSSKNTGKG